MKIGIRVVPNSKTFLLRENSEGLKIYLTSKAEKGKANLELVKELRKRLRREISIISGLKNRKKVIEIEGEKEEVLEAIKTLCDG